MSATPASWLFVKGNQSIWVVRPYGYSMIVSGPDDASDRRDFQNDAEVDAYQIEMAERLTAAGWILWGVGRQRRTGRDRRAYPRHVTDRRRATDPELPPPPSRERSLSDA